MDPKVTPNKLPDEFLASSLTPFMVCLEKVSEDKCFLLISCLNFKGPIYKESFLIYWKLHGHGRPTGNYDILACNLNGLFYL